MRLVVCALMACLAGPAPAADSFPGYSLSHSGRFVALAQSDGSNWLMDMSSGSRKPLGKGGKQPADFLWARDDKTVFVAQDSVVGYAVASGRVVSALAGSAPIRLLAVSPDGKSLSYVLENTLWVSSLDGKTKRALTQAGGQNLLIGIPDSLYGQEFGVISHYWWSPDSTAIAYIESEFADANHYVYPGGKLPRFRLKVIHLKTGKTQTVMETGDEWAYLLRVVWHPDSQRLFFYRLDRLQMLAELCSFEGGAVKAVLAEKDLYWINAPETPVFVNGGQRMVVSSERSGARHVYLYETDGRLVRDLTPDGFEVYRLHEVGDAQHAYVSGSNDSHQRQQVFRLSLEGGAAEPLTDDAGWHEVTFNADGNAFLDCSSSAVKAPSLGWQGANGARREVVAAAVDEAVVKNEFFTIKTHDNVPLPARLFKPDDFDAQKKYPVILYTFSGPHGRVVADRWGGWEMAWNRSMVRQGFLVLAVDVRGSSGYGHLFEEYIHYRFGAQETADLREVVNYLRRQSYVDGARLGIWGCGYGAHTVVHAMWQFPGGFKAGFADSPIADWTKYEAYFAERYLGLPGKRFNEYNDSTALHDARRMTGTLLVAASPDDPVIRPEQLEALKNAMAHLKRNPEVATRFHAVNLPEDVAKVKALMTDFFRTTL